MNNLFFYKLNKVRVKSGVSISISNREKIRIILETITFKSKWMDGNLYKNFKIFTTFTFYK